MKYILIIAIMLCSSFLVGADPVKYYSIIFLGINSDTQAQRLFFETVEDTDWEIVSAKARKLAETDNFDKVIFLQHELLEGHAYMAYKEKKYSQ